MEKQCRPPCNLRHLFAYVKYGTPRCRVRVFMFLLSGLFCCLGFSGVFFAVWAGACFFLLFGRGPRPRPNSKKKKHATAQTAKKKHAPAPSERVFFFAVWAVGCVYVFAVWAGVVFFFGLFGRGACSFFCCLGGCVFFFLLFGPGACSFFGCLGRGRVFFFAVWAGDGSSLTYPSAWLVFKRPNKKRDRTAKKKHGFPRCRCVALVLLFFVS